MNSFLSNLSFFTLPVYYIFLTGKLQETFKKDTFSVLKNEKAAEKFFSFFNIKHCKKFHNKNQKKTIDKYWRIAYICTGFHYGKNKTFFTF